MPRAEGELAAPLSAIDDLWSDHLAAVSELRSGIQWFAWGGRDPLHEYLTRVDGLYVQLEIAQDDEIAARVEGWRSDEAPPLERGATWTYPTTDNPFGIYPDRILKRFVAKFRSK